MKAAELMVGDLVCLKDDTKYELPLKVDGVLTDDISLEGEGFLGGAEGLIRPIPLTPEVLEKNPQVEELGYWDERGNLFRLYVMPCINLWSVDRLQKCLRLCGQFELAENFKL